MAVLLSHSPACALPRAFARVASHVHCRLHCPHRSKNFSSIGNGFRNLSGANYFEERSTGIAEAIRSPGLVAMEYAELNLPHICEEVGHVRIRQHVNPLSSAFSVPAEPPDWNVVFKDPLLPLMVDVGCGRQIKLVMRANFWVKELDLVNAHFMFANATISFEHLMSSYPGPLVFVSILCPDPHFKKRHHKRRVLQKPLVDSIVNNLTPGGQVFVQSDVLEVAADMRNQFDSIPDMLHIDAINPNFGCDPDGWLLNNPMGIRTEREIHAEHEGSRIYRRMYNKRT